MAQTTTKKFWVIGLVLALTVGLIACSKPATDKQDVLTIGISPPYAELLQSVADELKADGIQVKLVEFSDWHAPNVSVQNGDIDANFFQQTFFLNNAIKESGYDLHPFAVGSGSHVGLYSKKYSSLDALPEGARIVIPNDPVNLGRALVLLHRAGLIEIAETDLGKKLSTVGDILKNPKKFKFIEVEGPQTAHALNDADLAFGYPHYLKMSKAIDPKQALFLDPIDKRFAILFVTRKDYQDKDQKLAKFVSTFQSSEKVKAILDRDFGEGLWFAGWK
ncbi:MetQ/NlpA family ABC transporter substrate-binding protein [Acinetobacter sp.]|uniref:MetQ/NlpA family ABC transporter substrate-binding protein n=1 Tax=Acinetobacter sp. TaxID=472 RepID=UPI002897305F|nr:MetQ/NlpA family ABC transporter substrate-binding protein [Acinetobacter sp.]